MLGKFKILYALESHVRILQVKNTIKYSENATRKSIKFSDFIEIIVIGPLLTTKKNKKKNISYLRKYHKELHRGQLKLIMFKTTTTSCLCNLLHSA